MKSSAGESVEEVIAFLLEPVILLSAGLRSFEIEEESEYLVG